MLKTKSLKKDKRTKKCPYFVKVQQNVIGTKHGFSVSVRNWCIYGGITMKLKMLGSRVVSSVGEINKMKHDCSKA